MDRLSSKTMLEMIDELVTRRSFNLVELEYLLDYPRPSFQIRTLIVIQKFARFVKFSRGLPMHCREVVINVVKKMTVDVSIIGELAYRAFLTMYMCWNDDEKSGLFGAYDEIMSVVSSLLKSSSFKCRIRGAQMVELMFEKHKDAFANMNVIECLADMLNGPRNQDEEEEHEEEKRSLMAVMKFWEIEDYMSMKRKRKVLVGFCSIGRKLCFDDEDFCDEETDDYEDDDSDDNNNEDDEDFGSEEVDEEDFGSEEVDDEEDGSHSEGSALGKGKKGIHKDDNNERILTINERDCNFIRDDDSSNSHDDDNYLYYLYDCHLSDQKQKDAGEEVDDEELEAEEEGNDKDYDDERSEIGLISSEKCKAIVNRLLTKMFDSKQGRVEAVKSGFLVDAQWECLPKPVQDLKSKISDSEYVTLITAFRESNSQLSCANIAYTLVSTVNTRKFSDVFISHNFMQDLLTLYISDNSAVSALTAEAIYLLASRAAKDASKENIDKAFLLEREYRVLPSKKTHKVENKCNITFLVKGKHVMAQKEKLCSLSGYFNAMVNCNNFKDTGGAQFEINNVDHETFSALIHYTHHGSLPLPYCDIKSQNFDIQLVLSLLISADLYMMQELKYLCSRIVHIAISYRPQYLKNAYRCSDLGNAPYLCHSLILYACSKHDKLVSAVDGFTSFAKEELAPELSKWLPSIIQSLC